MINFQQLQRTLQLFHPLLIHKYNMHSENDIPEKDDFSYEYTYNPETDELLCKKTNKLGDSYEYRETITNFGYTITEKIYYKCAFIIIFSNNKSFF